MIQLPGKKHVIVPIGGVPMSKKDFRNIIAKLDGALAAKVHPDWVAWMMIVHKVDVIAEIKGANLLCFVDRKYDEIPFEVERNAKLWANLGADMLTAMVDGSVPMLQAAKRGAPNVLLLGVTVLTTMSEDDCQSAHGGSVAETVLRFVPEAMEGNCDGTVSAPVDLQTMRNNGIDPKAAVRIIPNIRFADETVANDDQNAERQATPSLVGELCGDQGAIVMGRPITSAENPASALERAETEYAAGMAAAA